jgi:hypothetical protein
VVSFFQVCRLKFVMQILSLSCVLRAKMDLKGIVSVGVGWINLARDRDQWRGLVNTVMNLRIT